MKTKKTINSIIDDEILSILNENTNNNSFIDENLNMLEKNKLFDWLKKNAPLKIFDDKGNIDWNYVDPNTGNDLITIIENFADFYYRIKSKPTIQLYKLFYLDSIQNINKNHFGTVWCFNENDINDQTTEKYKNGHDKYVVSIIVNTNSIDWELELYKIIDDSNNSSICYLKKRSDCLIVEVNNNEIKPPILGIL